MKAKAATKNEKAAAAWYDAEELKWAARQWAVRIGVKTPQIHVRQMKSKWASISTAGRLTLNADLLVVPRELGEYVIAHELIHLLAPNHGKVFKSFLYAYMPDWEGRNESLKALSLSLNASALPRKYA